MPSMDAPTPPVDHKKPVETPAHLYDVAPGKSDRLYQPGQSPAEHVKKAFQSMDNWSNAANPLRFTPNDWGSFSDHKQGSDPFAPQKSSESAPVDADKKTLLDNNASKQERLAAAEKLAAKGDTNFSVQDQNGSHNYRIEQSKIGKDGRSFLHVYAADGQNNKSESGNEHVMLRAISDGKGNFEQQKSSSGHKVGYEGDWWSRNAARFSAGDNSRKPDHSENDRSRKPDSAEHNPSLKPDRRETEKKPDRQTDQESHDAGLDGKAPHRRKHGRKSEGTDEFKQDTQRHGRGRGRHHKQESEEGTEERPSRHRSDAKPPRDHHLDVPEHPLEGTHTAIGTGYYPHNDHTQGGFYDERSSKKDPRPLHTLQDFLAGKTNEVTVAMDDKVPYGQKITIPEMDDKYRARLNELGYDHIPFVKKDSGSHFVGKGYSAIDICVKTKAETSDIEGNYTVNFVDSWGPEGKNQPNPSGGNDRRTDARPDARTDSKVDPATDAAKKPDDNKEWSLGRFGEALATVAKDMANFIHTVNDCARGPRLTLDKFGFHLDPMVATEQGKAIEASGLFKEVSRDEAQPGDYFVRQWSPRVVRAHGGVNKGDSGFVVKRKGDTLYAANDHHSVMSEDGGRYRDTKFLRPTPEFLARYGNGNGAYDG
jgi:hypothetical protein